MKQRKRDIKRQDRGGNKMSRKFKIIGHDVSDEHRGKIGTALKTGLQTITLKMEDGNIISINQYDLNGKPCVKEITDENKIYNKDKYIVINQDLKEFAGLRGTLQKKYVCQHIEMCDLLLDNYPKKNEQMSVIFKKCDLMPLEWADDENMKPNRYQELAVAVSGQWKFQNSLKDRIVYNTMSIAGEAGEVIEIVKKAIFQQNRQLNTQEIERIKDEISDQFWFQSALCDAIGLNFEDIMKHNLKKLNTRYPNGFTVEESINRKI